MKRSLTKDLTPIRTLAKARIDAEAAAIEEAIASKHPTHNVKYLEKAAEAREILEIESLGGQLDATDYPLLNAEVGITAATLSEVAQIVQTMRAQWKAATAQLETLRLQAKKDIDTATTPAAIGQAANVTWPQPV